jgi:lysophospholipase L1-like esterase
MGIRILDPQKTLFPRYIESAEFPIDFPASTELVHKTGSLWKFTYTTNEIGRRGAYLPISDEYSTHNVVVLGDSFTFGIGVNDHEVYTQIVAENLGEDFAVINGGMGGWGIDSEIKWYYKIGESYSPRFVVLQFTANDPGGSSSGVTRIEDEHFKFYPYSKIKPRWQVFLSSSAVLQNSHLYSFLRSKLDALQSSTATAGDATQKVDLKSRSGLNYIQMLELFAKQLEKRGIDLLFLSVTHPHSDPDIYHYDIDDFPVIKQKVERMASSGLLKFVQLPLDKMQRHVGSPEGHQWSAIHHSLVGEAIGKDIKLLANNSVRVQVQSE